MYHYVINAVNAIGTGVASTALAVTVASVPDQLGLATTSLSGLSARIDWPAPASVHSSAVTAYVIQIKKADGTYATSTECNGASPTVVTNRWCTILMTTLTSAPFSLTAGTPIIAEVAALNAAGQNAFSMDNTAYITAIREPLAATTVTITSSAETAIVLSWTNIAATTAANGGSPVTGYLV